uniref:Uncharacterized protein n=1 Tax=Crocodylus porosus TaxID=8502 RepID=A0A7M4EW65_CROPO
MARELCVAGGSVVCSLCNVWPSACGSCSIWPLVTLKLNVHKITPLKTGKKNLNLYSPLTGTCQIGPFSSPTSHNVQKLRNGLSNVVLLLWWKQLKLASFKNLRMEQENEGNILPEKVMEEESKKHFFLYPLLSGSLLPGGLILPVLSSALWCWMTAESFRAVTSVGLNRMICALLLILVVMALNLKGCFHFHFYF